MEPSSPMAKIDFMWAGPQAAFMATTSLKIFTSLDVLIKMTKTSRKPQVCGYVYKRSWADQSSKREGTSLLLCLAFSDFCYMPWIFFQASCVWRVDTYTYVLVWWYTCWVGATQREVYWSPTAILNWNLVISSNALRRDSKTLKWKESHSRFGPWPF